VERERGATVEKQRKERRGEERRAGSGERGEGRGARREGESEHVV